MKERLTAPEIVERLTEFPVKIVCLTGGEPMLQVDYDLVRLLKDAGFSVHLETNGTISVPPFFNWITVSPKDQLSWVQRTGDELKLVYEGQDLHWYEVHSSFKVYYLQPMSENYDGIMEIILAKPQWKICLQIQKILKVR
jgi:organic radical activating enzyme